MFLKNRQSHIVTRRFGRLIVKQQHSYFPKRCRTASALLLFSGLVLSLFVPVAVAASPLIDKSLISASALARAEGGFEPNYGQAPQTFRFIAREKGYVLLLSRSEIVLVLQSQQIPQTSGRRLRPGPGPLRTLALRMRFENTSGQAEMIGEKKLEGVSNYMIGGDPLRWQTDVPHFARIRYRGIYPGIDLVFHHDRGRVEYDLVVAPGADPRRVQITFEGAERVDLDRQGNLFLTTQLGRLTQLMPCVYQETGSGRRKTARARYVLRGERKVSLRFANFNHSKPLVIDPVLTFSTLLGGSNGDQATGVAFDSNGNAYVTGITASANFPTTPGVLDRKCGIGGACNGFFDVFVSKVSASGTKLFYSTYIGGSSTDFSHGIRVDSSGSAYVAGFTSSNDFPGTFLGPGKGAAVSHAFALKLNSTGSSLLYSKLFGGTGDTDVLALALDSSGHAYVTGETFSSDFPTTTGAFQRTRPGGSDAFVSKISATGSGFIYSTYVGGPGSEIGWAIAVDGSGNAYVAGEEEFASFPTTPGAFQPLNKHPNNGQSTGLVFKLNSSGSSLVYATHLGSSAGEERAQGIAIDTARNAYAVGFTESTDFPTTPGALKENPDSSGNNEDGFVSKLNPSGSALVYSTRLGGTGFENAEQVAVSPGGSAYVTGFTSSPDFPTTRSGFQRIAGGVASGLSEGFVSKLNLSGSGLSYSSFLGGSGDDDAPALALDPHGVVYVAGETSSFNFPVTNDAFRRTSAGGSRDAFVAKVTPLCGFTGLIAICYPHDGSLVAQGPIRMVVGTNDPSPVKLLQIYIDGKKFYEQRLAALSVKLTLSLGPHRLTAQAVDLAGVIFKKSVNITVVTP